MRTRTLLLIPLIALTGCVNWTPGSIKALSVEIGNVRDTMTVISGTLEALEVDDPNKYDSIQEEIKRAGVVTSGIKASVDHLASQPAVDPNAVSDSIKTLGVIVAPVSAGAGAIILALGNLVRIWMRPKKEDEVKP